MLYRWSLNQQHVNTFVLVDTNRDEVTGLGDTFSIFVSKAGGAFAAGTGTKAEIGNGWYSYTNAADEADTLGIISMYITGTGVIQQNLIAEVETILSGAIEFTYTVTDSGSGDPIEGVTTIITTDLAGDNIIWRGTTNASGVALDTNNNKPYLDAGTYYFWNQLSGYTFSNPDTEVVS